MNFKPLKPNWGSLFSQPAQINSLWSSLQYTPKTQLSSKPVNLSTFDPNAGKAEAYMKFMLEGNFRNGRKATLKFNEYWDADIDDRRTAWESTQRTNLLLADSERKKQQFLADSATGYDNAGYMFLDDGQGGGTWVSTPKTTPQALIPVTQPKIRSNDYWDSLASLIMGDGNTMKDVREFLQKALLHGWDLGASGVDGKFGNKTKLAWEAYLKNPNNWFTSGVTSAGSTTDINGNPVSTMYDSPNFLESWIKPIMLFKSPTPKSNPKSNILRAPIKYGEGATSII